MVTMPIWQVALTLKSNAKILTVDCISHDSNSMNRNFSSESGSLSADQEYRSILWNS
jgi:hypothetical protein